MQKLLHFFSKYVSFYWKPTNEYSRKHIYGSCISEVVSVWRNLNILIISSHFIIYYNLLRYMATKTFLLAYWRISQFLASNPGMGKTKNFPFFCDVSKVNAVKNFKLKTSLKRFNAHVLQISVCKYFLYIKLNSAGKKKKVVFFIYRYMFILFQ